MPTKILPDKLPTHFSKFFFLRFSFYTNAFRQKFPSPNNSAPRKAFSMSTCIKVEKEKEKKKRKVEEVRRRTTSKGRGQSLGPLPLTADTQRISFKYLTKKGN